MDRTYIKENQIIERYLMGKLTAEESDEFEQFYLTDQQTLDELEHAKRFYEGFIILSQTDETDETDDQ